MKTKLIFYVIALCSILHQYGCSDVEVTNNNEPVLPDIPVEQLLGYPDTIYIEGRQVYLSTYMWRDFMPISPPDGKPLIAINVYNSCGYYSRYLPVLLRMRFGSFTITRFGSQGFLMNSFPLHFHLIFLKKLQEKVLNGVLAQNVFL